MSIQDTVIKSIDETKDSAVGQIEKLGKNSVSDIGKLRDNLQQALKDLEKKTEGNIGALEASSTINIGNVAKKSCEEIKIVGREAVQSLTNIHIEINAVRNTVSDSMKEVQANGQKDIGQFVKQCQEVLKEIQAANTKEREDQRILREETALIHAEYGKMASEIKRANTLLALRSYPQEFKLISREEIELLLMRISSWYDLFRPMRLQIEFSQITPQMFLTGYHKISFGQTISWSIEVLRRS